jgi:hypothetical protein
MFMRLRNKDGQIAPFMVLVMGVLILAIAATVLIGETGFVRLRMANIADSALISGASSFCRSLNSIRPLHNKMLMNYISFQTAMLVSSPYLHKANAYAVALALTALYTEQGFELFDQACDIAKAMPKELRTSVYDTTLGGALIDEPKPFLETAGDPHFMPPLSTDTCKAENLVGWNEVGRDPQTKVVNYLNYPKYMQRDSRFVCQYRALKFGNGGWYNSGSLSYFFNKYQKQAESDTGKGEFVTPFVPGTTENQPEQVNFNSYLGVRLEDFPDSVDIIPMPMPIIFLYWVWCFVPCGPFCIMYIPCFIAPGFTIDPFSAIASIDFNSNFGLTVNKRIPFHRLPFFSRSVDLEHTSRVNIRGSVWSSGYDFSIQ